MKLLNKTWVSAMVLAMAATPSISWAIQQEEDEKIEIVNQDGEKIKLKLRKSATSKIDGSDIKLGNGKIVIVDDEGKKTELDVSNAQSIVVNKSVQSVTEDGQEKRRVIGKAIIVGPDGIQQEFQLADGDDKLPFIQFDNGGGAFKFLRPDGSPWPKNMIFDRSAKVGKFMIGVNCKPVSEELRGYLDLAEGVGLTVDGIPADDSPAAKAGITKHDILMYADQKELETIEDLVNAIQLAGKEDREMTITLLRRGKEVSVDLKPAERKQLAWSSNVPGFSVDVEEFGPGFVFDAETSADDILKRIEELQAKHLKEMGAMREAIRRQLSEQPDVEKDDD